MVTPILNQSLELAFRGVVQGTLRLFDYGVGSKDLQLAVGAIIILAFCYVVFMSGWRKK